MLVDGREDGRERKVSPRGRNRGLVERDETARRSKGVVRWKGSVGRRFHFVSLPACGGAIAAALCQSVTLSRHPFYYLARGCPAPLSIRSAPSLLAAPPTSHGYNVDQARGCLTGCRSFASLSLSSSFTLILSLYLVPSISLVVLSPVSGGQRELLHRLEYREQGIGTRHEESRGERGYDKIV